MVPGSHSRKCQDAMGTHRICGSAGTRNAADASNNRRMYAPGGPKVTRSQHLGSIAPGCGPENANAHHHETTSGTGRLLGLEEGGRARPPECPGPTWTSL